MTLATMVRPLMLLAATTLFGAGASEAQAPPAAEFDAKVESRKVIDALAESRFSEIEARYSSQMAEALPVGQLAVAWGQLTAQVGTMKTAGEPQVADQNGATVVTFPAEYEGAKLNLIVAWNAERKLVGLLAQPAG
ncbi:MAG: DUF3887 domain-containing protein [Gemmatimonadales bacterium]